ncbi:MAG: AmmeMemoRadiSam system protein A [Clostridia bacterium]|jgi:AmmeMemoRadiSam system protein A
MVFDVSREDRKVLLALARESIVSHLENRSPVWSGHSKTLDEHKGAFVTIHKHKMLRGCIGRMVADTPLEKTVRDMARAAAFEDPRFPPLGMNELDSIELEISVLSPMKPCEPEDILPGIHGAYLSKGYRSGVFLPQVATEQGWDQEAFLEHLCYKAGLPIGAYLDPEAKLMCFTAVVFGERDQGSLAAG